MSAIKEIRITDIVLKSASGSDLEIPDHSRIFVDVLFGEQWSERLGPLIKTSASSWETMSHFIVPTSVLSCRILISQEFPGQDPTHFGMIDTFSEHLVITSINQEGNVVETLRHGGDMSNLQLSFSCLLGLEQPLTVDGVVEELCSILHSNERSTDFLQEQALLLPNDDVRKLWFLNLAAQIYYRSYSRNGDATYLDRGICALDFAVNIVHNHGYLRFETFLRLGQHSFARFLHSPTSTDIDRAISSYEQALETTPDYHVITAACTNILATAYLRRFQRVGNLEDIHRAISRLEETLRLSPDDREIMAACTDNLATSYLRRFQRLGNLEDIHRAISRLEETLRLSPDGHADKPRHLGKLGILFSLRFERSGDLVDVDRAISARKKAVELAPDGHPDKLTCLVSLGNSFATRFKHLGNLVDCERAIAAHQKVIELTPDGHADKPDCFNSLGNSLLLRFERSGSLVDLDRAISVHEKAVDLTPDGHADKACYLSNLGASFSSRFQRFSSVFDADQAISAQEKAVELTSDPANKPERFNNLGMSLLLRYEGSGRLVDIDRAITALEQAVKLSPDGYAGGFSRFNNLGLSLFRRFERSGNLVDLDRAIFVHEEAVELTPDGHADRPFCLVNLGHSYLKRFAHLENPADADRAISAHEKAVELCPDGHANKPVCFHSLGLSLLCRFERSRNLVNLDRAISAHETAVKLTPDGHAGKHRYFDGLGHSLSSRFELSGNLVDLDRAISAREKAVALIPDDHVYKSLCFSHLGFSFLMLFRRSGNLVDVDQAISAYQKAVQLTPGGHQDEPKVLSGLGDSFLCRFQHTKNPVDEQEAMRQYRLSAICRTGRPLVRFKSALNWARLASVLDASASLEGFQVALGLIPLVAWLGRTITSRHKELVNLGDVAREAAAVAIKCRQLETAVEWLEQGRSIVWGQLLNLRTPFDELRKVNAGLADELQRVSRALDSASTRDHSIDSAKSSQFMEEAARSHRQLADEWDTLLAKVRAVPAFDDFLQPPIFSKLSRASEGGPVVLINVEQSRCDALIVIAALDEVIHVPLNFSLELAQELQRSMNQLLRKAGVRMRDERAARMVPTGSVIDGGFERILSTLWTSVVKPVIDALAFSQLSTGPRDLPRIWWCPTGPLNFLPIHAAGIYGTNQFGTVISDYVVSSYTPTLTALLGAPNPNAMLQFRGLLGVSQPNTPGQSSLPNAQKELAQIEQLRPGLNVRSLPGPSATVEAVFEGMQTHSWVHLACHAAQDTQTPTQSAFCLHDGNLTLSRIMTKPFPHADFAFLSACQTATGAEDLSDEAVHLAAGMLAAGYRSVIATMWSIKDDDAPLVAEEVYRHLVIDSNPDSTRAAHALHHAVQRLRNETAKYAGDASFLSWVPFIHVGL